MPGEPEPCLRGRSPLAMNCAAGRDMSAVAVSNSETSMTAPSPVVARRNSAVTMPTTPHSPVPMSMIDEPTRTGGRPSSPVKLMMPPNACISGS
jgi:hypothetical protein